MTTFTAMPKYDSYKSSGYEWIGDIPTSWDLTKLGACLTPVSTKNRADLPLLSITRELGVIERDTEDQDSNHNFIPDDLSGYKVIEAGQFGMNKMKAWQGSYGVSKYTGIVSPAYYVFKFEQDIDPDFFHWAIRSHLYISFFASASDGVRVGQWDLSKGRMKEIPFVFPEKKIQTAIANFLDEKIAKIDEAITIKEKQIELLKERKQIIIQQAVTQGLDPTVPMKDSGVEWIGQIPAHWEVRRGKFLFKKMSRPVRKEDDVVTCFRDGQVTLRTKRRTEGFTFALKEHGYQGVRVGDLVIHAMDAFAGAIGVSDSDGKSTPVYSVCTPVDETEIFPSYYAYYLRNLALTGFIESLAKGIRERSTDFRFNDFSELFFPLPPKSIQQSIVSYIDYELEKVDSGISHLLKQIEKLKEYKTTLINNAVTGKIKVV